MFSLGKEGSHFHKRWEVCLKNPVVTVVHVINPGTGEQRQADLGNFGG